jgi:NAD(P)-dependent dehydrogenase (short-subunit alcohol dehydrogenase family)
VEQLQGKVAVVTGAASGIGLGIVEALANRGARGLMADIINLRLPSLGVRE